MALLCGDWVVTPFLQVSDLILFLKIFLKYNFYLFTFVCAESLLLHSGLVDSKALEPAVVSSMG